ncbi:DUF2285 domain-containing protein [Mesorhizobium sp. WSM2239]|uniref:DUF2285 domain-containing protein n=2 Tax=unclassified Mesorhizobium TaxID=325217 RepID=A0AAU8D7W4_9HYPH
MLPLIAEPVSSSSTRSPFDLVALPCQATVQLTSDDKQHVLLRTADRHLQLIVTGASVLQPVGLRADAVWPADLPKHRLWALECLNALCAHGQLPARLFPHEKRSRRLHFVIRALDGSLAGASHRDIAQAVFGKGRVRADWMHPGDHLRDHIRRAVRRGRALMNGGYRDFLD